MEPVTPLAYIRHQMANVPNNNFIPDWKELSKQDKDNLVLWAREEMVILEVPIKPPVKLN